MRPDDLAAERSVSFEYETQRESRSSRFIKPAFGYFGAKQRLASRIIEMLPPHNAWVEAFCGSAVVTLNKSKAPIEVINDLDGNIVNLFKVLRDRSTELCRAVALTPYARDEFRLCRAGVVISDDLERARRFLVATMMTINGTSGSTHSGLSFSDSYIRGGREARVNRWYQLPERLEKVVERLRSVRVENKNALRLVEQYAHRPATLMYLDPPYLMDRRHTYSMDVNEAEFHEQLLERCTQSQCMIILSGYTNTLNSKYLNPKSGWTETSLATKTRGTDGIDTNRTEVLWFNNAFKKAKDVGRVPVKLTVKESTDGKINPQRAVVSRRKR